MKPTLLSHLGILAPAAAAVILPLAVVAAHQIIAHTQSTDTQPITAATSNIGVNHFAVHWFTDSDVDGQIHWGLSPDDLSNIVSDDRGDVASDVHQVDVDIATASASSSALVSHKSQGKAKSFDQGCDPASNTICGTFTVTANSFPQDSSGQISWNVNDSNTNASLLISIGVIGPDGVFSGWIPENSDSGTLSADTATPGNYTYYLGATDDGGNTLELTQNYTVTAPQNNNGNVSFTVDGTVYNIATNNPVPGAGVFATGQTTPNTVITGTNGTYGIAVTLPTSTTQSTICVTPPQGYTIPTQWQQQGGCVQYTVPASGQIVQVNIPIQSTQAANNTISGEVYLTSGQGISGATVTLQQLSEQTTTNQNGAYTFSSVPAGTYNVCVTNGPSGVSPVNNQNCGQVTVPPSTSNLNFPFEQTSTPTPAPSGTATPTPTETPTPLPSSSTSPLPTYCPGLDLDCSTPEPTATASPAPTATAIPLPTGETATPTPTSIATTSPSASATPSPTVAPVAPGFERIYYVIVSGGDTWGGTDLNDLTQNGQALYVDIPTTVSGGMTPDQCDNTAQVADCPDAAFGTVVDQNGNPVTDALVSITVTDSGQTSAPITAVTSDIGTYTLDIGNATLPSFSQYLSYNRNTGDALAVSASTVTSQSDTLNAQTNNDKPLSNITVNTAATPSPSVLPSLSPTAAPPVNGQTLTIHADFEGQDPANQNGPALLTNDTTGEKDWIVFANSDQTVIDDSSLSVGQTYSFTLKGFGHLTVVRSAIIQQGNTTVDFGTLTAGDIAPPLSIDGNDPEDDLIEVLDYSLLKQNLNQNSDTSVNAFLSDLNGNGVVDVVDLSILKSNFGLKGKAASASAEPSALP